MNKEKIFQILSSVINIETDELISYPEKTQLADIGLSSLKFIQFIVCIEEEFNIEVFDSDLLLSKFETIENIFTTLKKYFTDTCPV